MTTQQTLQTLSYLDPYPRQKPQLLIDISGIIRYDSHTGIPRVVKNQLKALQDLPQDLYTIAPIYLSTHPDTPPLHLYATTHTPISLAQGDIIYNPDLDPLGIKQASENHLYTCYKHLGIYIVTLIHDILPITHPHFFVQGQDTIHQEWLMHILKISDLLITTSDATATALHSYTPDHPPLTTIPLGTTTLGTKPTPKSQTAPNFLTVSTIEPRKAHAQILDAFELLWEQGRDLHLTIVGKQGWNVDALLDRIHTHPQNGKLLHYKAFVSDEDLHTLYSSSSALIVASYAEGFGLPLIEAAHYDLPIIARDLPVFHEIAKTHAFYFPDTPEADLLAKAILEWLTQAHQNTHPQSRSISYDSWSQNAQKLLQALSAIPKSPNKISHII